tara:strand:- start:35 stop:1222 length:1188 start_codon:yes stop_codon:yes gene_type:complete
MAEKDENKPLEEVVEEKTEQQEPVAEEAKEEVKEEVQEKPKNEVLEDGTIKLDLSSIEDNAPNADTNQFKTSAPVEEPVAEEKEEQPEQEPVLQEVTEEEVQEQVEELQEEVEEEIQQAQQTGEPLPENIQKVVDFMNETGGTLQDYVKLNQDYSNYDDKSLLREYYKTTKPHLTDDEVNFLMEDNFSYSEEEDDEKVVKRKKLALKEQVANAKSHLDGLKSKYYEEIKAGSRLTQEQQKAVDFFNRYEEEAKISEQQQSIFLKKTDNVFSDKFKGFDFNVGDKKYRFNVKDAAKVKETQSNINNFIKPFLNENNEISDAAGYHKSLFTAMNPDLVAQHFYEQGKADAIKDSVAKAKNVDMAPRGTHEKVQDVGGFKVRAVSGDSSNDFKIKIRK